VGVDAAFFNNKLDITYDYFIRRNKDMLTEAASHTATFGSDSPLGNNADMSTYGWELAAHFNAQPWYKPVTSNPDDIKLSYIEATNVDLIQLHESLPGYPH